MYRVERLFEKQGFNVIPYKVDYKASKKKNNYIRFYARRTMFRTN
jgi:uncharacterized SAM-binding protein YcdF (DUF218 family)